MMRPHLAPMRRRHLPEVVAIEDRVHVRPWSAGLFESELGHDDRHYLTAWSGRSSAHRHRTLLGYGGVMLVLGDAHITNVAVDPTHQRRGIASHIVLALLETALRRGATAATLEVRADNHPAQRLYSSFGFAPVGVRPRYYPPADPDSDMQDAIIMWVYDIDGPVHRQRLDARRADLGWAPLPAAPQQAQAVG